MYSKSKVSKAGEELVRERFGTDEFDRALEVLSYWRHSHSISLEKAVALVEGVAKKNDENSYVSKRLKREESIREKLKRYSTDDQSMSLKTMNDVGGCRVVCKSEKVLRQVVRELKKSSKFKNSESKLYRHNDYIKRPQKDGYRSYHLIGKFENDLGENRRIEVQLRTPIQHYWATALETVDLFSGLSLKIGKRSELWSEFFIEMSKQHELLESIYDVYNLSFADLENKYHNLVKNDDAKLASLKNLKYLERKLGAKSRFQAFTSSIKNLPNLIEEKSENDYYLLFINLQEKSITFNTFDKSQSEQAKQAYISQEKAAAGDAEKVVSLISTNAIGGIKEAYPNFFADSSKFIEYLDLILSVNTNRKNAGLFKIISDNVVNFVLKYREPK